MNLRKSNWTLVVALALCATVAIAQDQKQDTSPIDPNAPLQPLPPLDTSPSGGNANKPPIGAARGVTGPYDPQPYDPAQVTPDQNTLAGVAPLTLGSIQHTQNIFDPAISFSLLGQTYPNTTGPSTLIGTSVISGSLNFDRTWSRYHFTTLYNGGEIFNLGYGGANSTFGSVPAYYQFHDLIVTQEVNWARWHILLRDDFMASPYAAFAGQGMGGPGLVAQFSSMLGAALNSFGQEFLPTENINTGAAMHYRNAVLGQAEYSFSRRSAFTFAGSYGLLHFTEPGFVSSTMLDAQAGYDYLLDPSNSIAILASYGKIDYTGTLPPTTGTSTTGTSTIGTGASTTDYMGALAYGRKITGRLAFQVAAGPERIISAGAGGIGNFQLWNASISSALSYEKRRGGVSFNFMRGLNPGSGVFLGALSNTTSGTAHYQFTRYWTGSVNSGYSLDNSLAPAGTATTQFDTWFIGANLGRRVGTHAQVNFNYGVLKQNSPPNCPVTICGIPGFQQTFGMTVNLHLRPTG